MTSEQIPTALVTGASRGLGLALTTALVQRGWHVVVDGRDPDRLARAVAALPRPASVTAVAGDVADEAHRAVLADAVAGRGRLDLLVHNASVIGPSPLVPLADHPLAELVEVFAVNAVAPIALTRLVIPALRTSRGRVVHVSSDAAVEAYPRWGAYGAAKAALEHAARVLAVEEPEVRSWSFDPGDMRTELHAAAEPGVDLSDLPLPEDVVPPLLRLLDEDRPSGRYTAAALAPVVSA